MRFVWKNLPVFLIWLIGLSVLNNALHHISPPVTHILWLSVFPLACSLVLLWFALIREYGKIITGRYLFWAGIMCAVYFTPAMHSLSIPLDPGKQLMLYEISALMQFVLIMVHSRTWFEKKEWIWVFGITLLFGIILENGGIIIGYFSEPEYHIYIPGLKAPVATAIGWVNVLYCAFFAVQKLLPVTRPFPRGIICALIGLCMDIPFDPVATRLGWWVWNDSLDMGLSGVPMVNYIAWFWAIFPYTALYYWFRHRDDIGEGKQMGYFIGMFPVLLVAEVIGVVLSLALIGDANALMILKSYVISLIFE
ncbi:MAG: carotenoid biosynthesis protein [Deltaproteobacteria bacterium]|nr:carotenoid biosynthesis protein [Deltaproteobacteria bacterium]